MIVTLAAGHGEAHPSGGRGVHPVKQNVVPLLLGDGAALPVQEMVAVEGGRHFLGLRGVWQKIPRKLFN